MITAESQFVYNCIHTSNLKDYCIQEKNHDQIKFYEVLHALNGSVTKCLLFVFKSFIFEIGLINFTTLCNPV